MYVQYWTFLLLPQPCQARFFGDSGNFWESQVIFVRVRLFLGESGYFWESQVIFGRVRLFLGDSGYFWEIQVIIGRVYYGLAVETYVHCTTP